MKLIKKLTPFILCFILFTSMLLSQSDTTKEKFNNLEDTLIIRNTIGDKYKLKKGSNSDMISSLLQLLPYIIALGGIGISAYALYNQRIITQKQINADTKRKFRNDMIEQINSISKLVFTLYDITEDFQISKKKCEEIFKMIEYNKEKKIENRELEEELLSISRNRMYIAETNFNQIYKLSKEFYHNTGSIFLYLPRNHKDYKSLKRISEKLNSSFSEYMNCFSLSTTPEEDENNKEKTKELGDKLSDSFSALEDKILDIIDEEYISIGHIFTKSKKSK